MIELGPRYDRVGDAVLHGGEGALRTCRAAMAAWRAAGAPGPGSARADGRAVRRPHRLEPPVPGAPDGAATMTRGAHRWTLRYG